MSHALVVDRTVKAKLLDLQLKGQELELWCWAACTEMILTYLRSITGVGEAGGGATSDPLPGILQGEQMNRRNLGRGEIGTDCACSREKMTTRDYRTCNYGGWPYFYEFDHLAQSTQWSSRRFVLEQLGLPLREDGWPRRTATRLSSRQLRQLVEGADPLFRRRLDDAEDCALSWPMLRALLDDGSPVLTTWRYRRPGTGHMMVAAGYLETPPDRKWVVMFDPLPPDSGDAYIVPYEHYVAGPYGRHWRDYWIPRRGGPGAWGGFEIDDLAVGRELDRSWVPVSKVLPARPQGRPGYELSGEDRAAVHEAAEEGLEAVRAIARDAPELAVRLGLGGNFLQLVGPRILATILRDHQQPELAREVESEPALEPVEAEDLVLDDGYLPVFEVTARDLAQWDGLDARTLLTSPSQVIWVVQRKDYKAYDFFAAVTVRRFEDGWRLVSLGRANLMAALANLQFDHVLNKIWGSREPLSFRGLVDRLAELRLLEVLAKMAYGWIQKLEKFLLDAGEGELPEELRSAVKKRDGKLELPEPFDRLVKILSMPRGRLDVAALQEIASKADADRGVEETDYEEVLPRPRFIVDVAELYQMFIAETEDVLQPVYSRSFYPPGRRIEGGDPAIVFQKLRDLSAEVERDGF